MQQLMQLEVCIILSLNGEKVAGAQGSCAGHDWGQSFPFFCFLDRTCTAGKR